MTCAFCALEFDARAARHQCAGCTRLGGCRSVRCPRCAYEMPEPPALLERLLRLGRPRAEATRAAPTSLAQLRPGERAVVMELDAADDARLRKCLALGILPGVTLTLQARSPSFVFDVGFSRFAVDEELASAVVVQLQ